MIRARRAVQVHVFMVAAVQTLDFRIIRATRITKVVIANRIIKEISSSQVIRVTQSSRMVGSIMYSPLVCASVIRSFTRGL